VATTKQHEVEQRLLFIQGEVNELMDMRVLPDTIHASKIARQMGAISKLLDVAMMLNQED